MSKRRRPQPASRVVRDQIARERRRRTLWISVVDALLLVIAGMIGYGVYAGQRPATYTAPPGATGSGAGVAIGDGPVTVDVYADFMCPACRQFEEAARATLDELVAAKKVTIVYHPVAYLDRFSTTEYSTRSSAASGCAAEAGRFADYVKALYARQPSEGGPGLSDEELTSLGAGLGFGDTFGGCVSSGKYRAWTAHVTDVASKRGVLGTPSVYVDGKPVNADPNAIRAAVDAAK